ncbi:MAG: ATP-binding cassette domain-containing protein [Saprospiraceae bacterium]|nr:ATP-binding cassette domain-containing protein [Saprospiraceae bacterium]
MIVCNFRKQLQGAGGLIHLHANFEFPDNSFTILSGDSGAGKTSILRILAGLMAPESGTIVSGNTIWFDADKKINLVPQKRKVGFVFQDQALFPNMTVKENLEFARRDPSQNKLIREIVELFELGDLQNLKPATLSGGQKQKVALARSIINQPDILLLDEPLSALDQRSKIMLQSFIQKIHYEFKLTTIMVSHDLSDIHRMADRVLKLNEGIVVVSDKKVDQKHDEEIKGRITKIEEEDGQVILQISLPSSSFQKIRNKKENDNDITLS